METVLQILNRLCCHPFTTTAGAIETCSWCFAWRRVCRGDVAPGAWRRD